MRKGTPAPALYGGSQCHLRGGLTALPSADTNLLLVATWYETAVKISTGRQDGRTFFRN
jgi:hypothetical protein